MEDLRNYMKKSEDNSIYGKNKAGKSLYVNHVATMVSVKTESSTINARII